MENKCNKTPNNKYLDHVYCHNSDSKNYIRANNNAGGGGAGGGTVAGNQDVMALLKENKQLKAMLILHLDLIQEQSDQLMAKDKVLCSLREEAENFKTKNVQLETQVQELQKQLQRQMKRMAAGVGEVSTLPPPPLAKIQCKVESDASIVHTLRIPAAIDDLKSLKDGSSVKEQQERAFKNAKKNYIIQDVKTSSEKPVKGKCANIIGECNGKLISKIILHRVNTAGLHSPISTASDSASEIEEISRRHVAQASAKRACATETCVSACVEDADETEDSYDGTATNKRVKRTPPLSLAVPRGAKPRKPLPSTASATAANVKVCITPPTPSRGGKQMPLMLTHAPELHSDESASCDSVAETEQRTASASSPALSLSPKHIVKQQALAPPPSSRSPQYYHAKARRCGYISTTERYSTRAWEDEEFNCNFELIKDEANTLQTDAPPSLEIPKWTEHEISVSYCIEGTEDLSDDTFLKRHSKLEVDEKRRKKWDVQQIREQRRIEKLKRRHCKDELLNPPEQQPMSSFYPPPDAIQMICYVNDLPVQAFGELIPKLNADVDFVLPWLVADTSSAGFSGVSTLSATNASTTSMQAQQQLLTSSFVFMQKRRRQQSSSGAPTTRQRQAALIAAKTPVSTTSAMINTPIVPSLVTPTTTAGAIPNPTVTLND